MGSGSKVVVLLEVAVVVVLEAAVVVSSRS